MPSIATQRPVAQVDDSIERRRAKCFAQEVIQCRAPIIGKIVRENDENTRALLGRAGQQIGKLLTDGANSWEPRLQKC